MLCVVRVCAAVALVCLASLVFASQSSREHIAEERVWLAVEEQSRSQLRIEPIATIAENQLVPVQTSCLDAVQPADDLASKYLQPGRTYTLFFGGANIGEGIVGEANRAEQTAILAYAGPTKLRGQARALATNVDYNSFRPSSREPATSEQRSAALALAREVFARHGIPGALLPKVRAEYVARSYLVPSAQASLIGSFTLDTEGLVHSLFFVTSQPLERLEPELLWIHLAENATEEELLRFVDHADLFGDGQDEIVTKLISVETQSHRYLIFRRSKIGAFWEQIFKSEPVGCSS